jgi:hypothetical protein
MLWTLLDGRVYTATELAICANISAQAAQQSFIQTGKGKLVGSRQPGAAQILPVYE